MCRLSWGDQPHTHTQSNCTDCETNPAPTMPVFQNIYLPYIPHKPNGLKIKTNISGAACPISKQSRILTTLAKRNERVHCSQSPANMYHKSLCVRLHACMGPERETQMHTESGTLLDLRKLMLSKIRLTKRKTSGVIIRRWNTDSHV